MVFYGLIGIIWDNRGRIGYEDYEEWRKPSALRSLRLNKKRGGIYFLVNVYYFILQ